MALEIKRDIFPVSNISFSQDCAENLYWVLQSQRICVVEIRVLLQTSYRFGGPYSDSLRDARSVFESRWEQENFIFSISVQTGPEAHPDFFTMGTRGLPQR